MDENQQRSPEVVVELNSSLENVIDTSNMPQPAKSIHVCVMNSIHSSCNTPELSADLLGCDKEKCMNSLSMPVIEKSVVIGDVAFESLDTVTTCSNHSLIVQKEQIKVIPQPLDRHSSSNFHSGIECKEFKLGIYQKMKALVYKNLGTLSMVLASFAFSLMGLQIKVISLSDEPLPSFEIVFIRSLIMTFLCTAHSFISKLELPFGPRELRIMLILRGFIAFIGINCTYYALTVLSIGDATALTFTAPIFTGIAGRIFLKEKWEVLL